MHYKNINQNKILPWNFGGWKSTRDALKTFFGEFSGRFSGRLVGGVERPKFMNNSKHTARVHEGHWLAYLSQREELIVFKGTSIINSCLTALFSVLKTLLNCGLLLANLCLFSEINLLDKLKLYYGLTNDTPVKSRFYRRTCERKPNGLFKQF